MRELLEMVLAQPVTNTKGETATMKEEQQTEIHVICKKGDVWQLGDRQLKCGDRVRLEQVKELMK